MTTRRFPVDGILFDCDGVLVDSLEPAAIAWDAWAARYSPGYDFRSQIAHGVRAADTVAGLVEPQVFDEAVAALEEEEVLGAAATRPIPGAVALTTSIPLGRWAVVTSAARRLAVARLAAAGHPAPSALVTADDVEHGKPHPDPYLRGAEALRVPVHACAVFEDAPAGVRAARAAGAGLVVGVGDHLEGEPVDAHVDDLSAAAYEDGAILIRTAPAEAA
ncbi:HAD-IA family hydrolase [Microbacterium betulae]|uniref:HAD-IA family hydrolase n=1 Tax=Microbacterium betulae TaxID=2981139 RepID=A0AA97FGS6_9MICO|nr:HAD-IA family hydrolase [Microbacterium sp. AB]WOF22898.1 HAD-IA family hydrolase [Microbacterium sp. AB]